jgi:hypothetical protein
MERMDFLPVPGKRNRRVPILIVPEVVGIVMQLLVNTWDSCGTPTLNRFFCHQLYKWLLEYLANAAQNCCCIWYSETVVDNVELS